ncbi:MAG: AAA family ATPase [Gammaproteobacteria bacterium]
MSVKQNNTPNPGDLHELLDAIQRHTRFDHPVKQFEVVETHISLILLTGQVAYKFKKPVNLGFLDFTTLEKRRYYCEEEVRLNSRYSPELYIGVSCFTGDAACPRLNGEGEILEYAVKLLQFPAFSELKYAIDKGRLTPVHIDQLARDLAGFHAGTSPVPHTRYAGSPNCVRRQALDNFLAFKTADKVVCACSDTLARLEDWSLEALAALQWEFTLRKHNGHIRDCHGDLHLGNIILYQDRPRLFDCIEFSDELRMIDVISEVAFLVMDFDRLGHAEMGRRFLNAWLQHSGDYAGVAVLRFYLVYRAMVRAKVACLRLNQQDTTETQQTRELAEIQAYLEQALRYTSADRAVLLITHGLSGSGKTRGSQPILESLGAIRIRSDVERKRLYSMAAGGRAALEPEAGLYSPDKSQQTYQWLRYMAKRVLTAGYPVIVDAAFLRSSERRQMQVIAEECNVPFVILDFYADYATLRSRIVQRQQQAQDESDADTGVLDWQIRHQQPLEPEELSRCVRINTDTKMDTADIIRQIRYSSERYQPSPQGGESVILQNQ